MGGRRVLSPPLDTNNIIISLIQKYRQRCNLNGHIRRFLSQTQKVVQIFSVETAPLEN